MRKRKYKHLFSLLLRLIVYCYVNFAFTESLSFLDLEIAKSDNLEVATREKKWCSHKRGAL